MIGFDRDCELNCEPRVVSLIRQQIHNCQLKSCSSKFRLRVNLGSAEPGLLRIKSGLI